jgi:hypothetical protein
MSIHTLVDRLCNRLHDTPQFTTQGATLFVDLERRETRRKYLPAEVLTHFLGGRGANMWLLYNLLQEEKDALDPEIPLIFGSGVLTSVMPSATRGNFTSKSPESYAILDAGRLALERAQQYAILGSDHFQPAAADDAELAPYFRRQHNLALHRDRNRRHGPPRYCIE